MRRCGAQCCSDKTTDTSKSHNRCGTEVVSEMAADSRCGHTTVVKCQIIVLFLYGEYTIRIFAEAAVLALPARSICFVFLAD